MLCVLHLPRICGCCRSWWTNVALSLYLPVMVRWWGVWTAPHAGSHRDVCAGTLHEVLSGGSKVRS